MRILGLLMIAGMGLCGAQPAPTGQLVDVGGYRVHVYCTGQGSPTVMIVGQGFSFDWDLVQTEVAKFTRVCTYDPAGNAWSDAGPALTCQARLNEVHELLAKSSEKGPYVLVGLSFGALVARVYAGLYPSEVAGLVFVDHAFIDIGHPKSTPRSAPGLDSAPVLIDQTPITFTVEDSSDFKKLPERDQKLHQWAESLHPVLPTVETAQDCFARLKRPEPLVNQRVGVVSTGNELPNYHKLQVELLSLSVRSKQFMAVRSFHSVEIDQPEVVVEAIRFVVGGR
ncbi:MAG TPA: alpha/beta hydrolase [Bryobacteraceae bacterium]|nr:alpha/beta hydrolase [Bryobacteraceae bacterium]